MVDIALPVSGGVAPRSRVLTDGPDRLPYGLRLSRDGHVFGVVEEDGGSGEPVRLGRYDVRVGVDDVTGTRATIDLRLEVVEPPAGSSADWASLAGSFAKCGVRVDGVGSCWGWNDHGTVGDGTGHDSDRPVPLAGRWREIVSRGATTCGVQSDGSGWCWGRNDNGQVGDGSTEDRVLPTRLPGTWRTILLEPVLGSTACGIRTDASGWCWGYNGYAQVGDGTNVDRLVPTRLRGEWARLTLSSYGACGVRTDASGWCWGELDLKPGPQLQHRVPQRVAGSWESLVAGTTPCGVRTDDTAWCWGANADGEVGVAGTGDVVWPPAQLPGRWRQVVGGDFSQGAATSCGIRTDGSGWCWGDNASGQVGDGTTVNRRVPRQLPGSWRSLVVSHDATVCGVQPDGSGWCWGSNFDGQLGDGTLRDRSTPTRLPGSWESVVVVAGSTCGVQVDGTGWCWGGGPAGDGETDDARVPTRVP
jgi:hypothetical protein